MKIAFSLGVVLLLLALPAAATPITGTLNFSGDGIDSFTSLTYVCAGIPCPANYGSMFTTNLSTTGSFSTVRLSFGLIHNLSAVAQPVGSPFSLPAFITFPADPDISLELTYIEPGSFGSADCLAAPAIGQQCTPVLPPGFGLSAFNLANQAGTVPGHPIDASAVFSVSGYAHRISTGEISGFSGVFSAQFPGQSYQELLAILAVPGGTIGGSYSATIIAYEIPEPSTIALTLGGLFILAGAVRRRR